MTRGSDDSGRIQVTSEMPGRQKPNGLDLVQVIGQAVSGALAATMKKLGLFHALQRSEITLALILEHQFKTAGTVDGDWEKRAEQQLLRYQDFFKAANKAAQERAESDGSTGGENGKAETG